MKPHRLLPLLHASTPRQRGIWPKHLEAGSAGDFWQLDETITDAADRTKGRHIISHTHDSERPLGEWNTKVVRCEGAEIHFKQISLRQEVPPHQDRGL